MVVIDKERCTGCGTCVKVCHEHCMSLVEKRVTIDVIACSTCAQCIAVCAQKALSWDGTLPVDFEPAFLPTAPQMAELFMERRTIRSFKDEPLDRTVLEEIVSWGGYAPTHDFHLRCIAVDDPAIIEAFDEAALRFSRVIYRLLFRPRVIHALVHLLPRSLQNEFEKGLPKLETVVGRGRAYDSHPPALVCLVGDARVPLSLESAQYALHTMTLAAQVRGVGCRNLVGNQMIFNRSREVRRRLGLAPHEKILAVAGFGHPAVRFRNKVVGKGMVTRWNGGAATVWR